MKKLFLAALLLTLFPLVDGQGEASLMAQSWPKVNQEAKPGARWWWLGSAVDKENLEWNIQQYANKGIGALEITPIYGVQGNDTNNIDYLSPKWMQALKDCETLGAKYGVQIDMNCGTGWPFGGPEVTVEDAATKLVYTDTIIVGKNMKKINLAVRNPKDKPYSTLSKVMAYLQDKKTKTITMRIDITSFMNGERLNWSAPKSGHWLIMAFYNSKTRQKVKRAAPGGEGFVLDHFNKKAVMRYLEKFDKAFTNSCVAYPNTFFNDSYEVYGANWTPSLFNDFERLRGYNLAEYMPELLGFAEDNDCKVLTDYRETISDLLLTNFTKLWTNWAHSSGAKTRNQAHGSPANLIDQYAAVDIPEIEGFGKTDFGIKGLWKETKPEFIRKNDSDLSMLKYASSAAHITGKPFTSSETFTWLTEHFRTSLAHCKPDFDLMMVSGVNHVYFHGTCYSPKDDTWPGWKFYASIDMSPTNSIWHDAQFFYDYITRCQSFMQYGQPDNDFLIYLPIRDMWSQPAKKGDKRADILLQFAIHNMGKLAPDFIKDVLTIDSLGYDCDYISEKYLLSTTFEKGMLVTAAGTKYKALILPANCKMTDKLKSHIEELKSLGAHIVTGVDANHLSEITQGEEMKNKLHLKAIRRSNDTGYHYFISNLTPNDVDEEISLSVPFGSIILFNPLNGTMKNAIINNQKVRLALRSGESVILQTYNNEVQTEKHDIVREQLSEMIISTPWEFSFIESAPEVLGSLTLDTLQTWEKLPMENANRTMGTGVYETSFYLTDLPAKNSNESWSIDLGDVRESARVYINGDFVGCAWSVPYILDCGKYLKIGKNFLRIEVTNLPANRIADLDRQGVKWRKFNEINLVKLDYKKGDYSQWDLVPSGLKSQVKLIRYQNSEIENQTSNIVNKKSYIRHRKSYIRHRKYDNSK